MPTTDRTAPDATAACDKHLPMLLREIAQPLTEGQAVTIPARITRLDKPDQAYSCVCGVPAHWYVRRLEAAGVVSRAAAAVDEQLDRYNRSLDTEMTRNVALAAVNAALRGF